MFTFRKKSNIHKSVPVHVSTSSKKAQKGDQDKASCSTGHRSSAVCNVGLDYDHGPGHGVGAYLNVHEGPQRISKYSGQVALQPGMVISNEPGYYKTGEYGIRIENLVNVVNVLTKETSEQIMLEFETLTMAPIDVSLINQHIMTREECSWLNAYHELVRDRLEPELRKWPQVIDWLFKATLPINIE